MTICPPLHLSPTLSNSSFVSASDTVVLDFFSSEIRASGVCSIERPSSTASREVGATHKSAAVVSTAWDHLFVAFWAQEESFSICYVGHGARVLEGDGFVYVVFVAKMAGFVEVYEGDVAAHV